MIKAQTSGVQKLRAAVFCFKYKKQAKAKAESLFKSSMADRLKKIGVPPVGLIALLEIYRKKRYGKCGKADQGT